MHLPRRLVAVAAATGAVAAFGVLGPSPQAIAATPTDNGSTTSVAGSFYPVDVQRLLGTPGGGGYGVLADGSTTVTVQGHPGLPSSGVSAVVANVVISTGSRDSVVSVSADEDDSAAQKVRIPASTTRAVLLTVPLAMTGGFRVHATADSTVSVDLEGFYAADDTVIASVGTSGGYQPVDPQRVYDSAAGTGPVAAKERRLLSVDLGAASSHVTALLLRVNAAASTAAGSLSVEPSSSSEPWPSVAYPAGTASSNLAVVPAELDNDGRLDVSLANNGAAPTNVSVDLIGFYDDGQLGPNLRFRPLAPTAVTDTATDSSSWTLPATGTVTVTPDENVLDDSTFGLVGLLQIAPASAGHLTDLTVTSEESEADTDLAAATLTTSTASVSPVQPEVGADGSLQLSSSTGTGAVSLDVVGTFESSPPVADGSPRTWVPPISGWQIDAVAR